MMCALSNARSAIPASGFRSLSERDWFGRSRHVWNFGSICIQHAMCRFGSAAGLRAPSRWGSELLHPTSKPSGFLLVHACRRGFRWRLRCARLWNDCFPHGCGWHFRLIVHICVFSINRFAVERVDQFAFSCLPYGRTVTKNIVVLCKCRCRQKQYCGFQSSFCM
jgi:hypothetical protein